MVRGRDRTYPSADLRAFDLIGYDLAPQAVPELATLALLGLGRRHRVLAASRPIGSLKSERHTRLGPLRRVGLFVPLLIVTGGAHRHRAMLDL